MPFLVLLLFSGWGGGGVSSYRKEFAPQEQILFFKSGPYFGRAASFWEITWNKNCSPL